jgi:hypothetical protein
MPVAGPVAGFPHPVLGAKGTVTGEAPAARGGEASPGATRARACRPRVAAGIDTGIGL